MRAEDNHSLMESEISISYSMSPYAELPQWLLKISLDLIVVDHTWFRSDCFHTPQQEGLSIQGSKK